MRKKELVIEGDTTSNFTKVSNELIFHPVFRTNRAAACLHLWLMLSAIAPRSFHSLQELCEAISVRFDGKGDYNFFTLRKHLDRMVELGLLIRGHSTYALCIPDPNDVVKLEKKPKAVKPPKEKDIVKGLEQEPRRQRCAISTADRWSMIQKAWNTYKPDNFLALKDSKDDMLFAALETHTKHLKIDRKEYPAFIKIVCASLKKNEWWSSKPSMRAHSVFGIGVQVEDKKLRNVERLYQESKKNTSVFDIEDDNQVRRWYDKALTESYRHLVPNPQEAKVYRITQPSGPDIYALEVYCRQQVMGEGGGILDPEMEARLAKMDIRPEWHADSNIIRVYYLPDSVEPVSWSYKQTLSRLRTLPSEPIK